MTYVELHQHTEFSALDGLNNVSRLATRAAELSYPALAITDHGTMGGTIRFYQACRKAGIKPILGYEAYVTLDGLPHDGWKTSSGKDEQKSHRGNTHLTLLAADHQGYQNLLKLATTASTDGFYYKPRISRSLLAEHGDGLIVLSGCMGSEISKAVMNGRDAEATSLARWYAQTFPGRFFIELHQHGMVDDGRLYPGLVELAEACRLPMVAANDGHYLLQGDDRLHDVEMRVQTAGTYGGFETGEFYLKSRAEMEAMGFTAAALDMTLSVAQMCNVELELGKSEFPRPAGAPAEVAEDRWLWTLACEGAERLYGRPLPDAILDRLRYEAGVIEATGYVRYFLIVADMMRFARSAGIPSSARGSAAGSLVAYALGITPVDPMRYNLPFERFLNEGRTPDIDLDFADARRHEVMRYLAQTYGEDRVAQLATFGHMGGRMAVKDVARVMGLSFDDANVLSKKIPAKLSITEARAQVDDLREVEGLERQILDTAEELEGTVRSTGTHAAGVVLGARPLVEYTALKRGLESSGLPATQIDMRDAEVLGLVKFDILGLATLSIVADTVALVERHRGIKLDMASIPDWDARAEDLLQHGETTGVFQLESAGMRRFLKALQAVRVEDIMAMVALYRPGPLLNIPTFIARKNGEEEPSYPDPRLEPILRDTYGVWVYQEAIMEVAQWAGFTKLESDKFLYAVRKKVKKTLDEWEPRFRAALAEKGLGEDAVQAVWEAILPFADYGFNRAHAACYGRLAYDTAFLKANYTPEYMAALLTSEAGDAKKVAAAVAEARRFDVPVLGPDVNKSEEGFTVEGVAVRFGLQGIKNVGKVALGVLFAARINGGSFASLADLRKRCGSKVNVRVLESLVWAGALDSLGDRGFLLMELKREPLDDREAQIQAERAVLGVALSDSLLALHSDALLDRTTAEAKDLADLNLGEWLTIGGQVVDLAPLTTKKGDAMAALTISDWTGDAKVTIFPRTWATARQHVEEGKVLVVRGRLSAFAGDLQVNASSVEVLG